jgi:hypothetical protein
MALAHGAKGGAIGMLARSLVLLTAALVVALPARDVLGETPAQLLERELQRELGPGVRVEPSASASPTRLLERMPQELAGFARFGQLTDYEVRPGGAGFGASMEFRDPRTGAIGTVYIYTRGRTDLTDGADGRAVEQELDLAGQEVQRAGQIRDYTVTRGGRAPDFPSGGKPAALRCDAYVVSFRDGRIADTYACVGMQRGRFLKVRFSVSRQSGADPVALLTLFGNAVLTATRRL